MINVASIALASIVASAPAPLSPSPLAPQSKGAALPSTVGAPKVYVFPMHGQMGTDVSKALVEIMKEDIRKQKPDIIIYHLKSADIDRIEYLGENDDRSEFGIPDVEGYRDLAKDLHESLADIPQVMWVEDSVGIATLMALAWSELYMKSDARLWGLSILPMLAQHPDEDVAAKFLAAVKGYGNGVLQMGGYPEVLGDAMMLRERRLSVRFKGREVEWLPDTSGTWIVDNSEDRAARFDATVAEEVLLSDGTADSIDDLMFLLGYREYTELESGKKLAKQYTEDWRKALERVQEWMQEYQDAEEGAESAITALGKQRSILEKVLATLKQYPAVEARVGRMGVNQTAIQIQIDNLRKDIQRLRDAERGNRGGNNGGGRGPGGMGGGRR
jgi:hypothetical protein